MMTINLFCGMVDGRKVFVLFPAGIIVRDPHHRESHDTPQAGFEPAQNLSSGLVE